MNWQLSFFLESINYKWQKAKISTNWSYPVSGGMLVRANGDAAINCYGEVGIIFEKYNRIKTCENDYLRNKFIKKHIANDLKDFWKFITQFNMFESITIEGVTYDGEQTKRFNAKVDYNEFCILYEFLKGRDLKKIKAKYGETDFKKIIGEKPNDQFSLIAIESIINEISKLIKERDIEQNRLKKEQDQILREILNKHKKELELSKNSYNEKIKKLEEQIMALKMTS